MEEESYEVHKVVDKRVNKNRRVEYQVDWGPRYTQGRYTWEPEANLKNAKDKIGDYLQSLGGGAVDSERRKRKKKK